MSDRNVMGAVDPQVVTTMEGSSKKKIATSTSTGQKPEEIEASTGWKARTDRQFQMAQLSLRNNRLKFETIEELPILLEGSI